MEKKIASKATYLLSQLLVKHPAMKIIVVTEVERFVFRPNMSDRARYYSITFLNQIMLTQNDDGVADKLIHVYFSIFQVIVKTLKAETAEQDVAQKKKKPRKFRKPVGPSKLDAEKQSLVSIDSVNSKMMAALLTGVNRAFPFAKLDSKM